MRSTGRYTGLRVGALARLTPEAFTVAAAGVPTAVFSAARQQKNKSAHGVPLAPTVGVALAAWLAGEVAKLPSLGSALGTEGGGTSGKGPPIVEKRSVGRQRRAAKKSLKSKETD